MSRYRPVNTSPELSDVAGRGVMESGDVAGRGVMESGDVAGRGVMESGDVAGRGVMESTPPQCRVMGHLASRVPGRAVRSLRAICRFPPRSSISRRVYQSHVLAGYLVWTAAMSRLGRPRLFFPANRRLRPL